MKVQVISKLQDKRGSNKDYKIEYELQYFQVKVMSGELTTQDPEEFILDIGWKSVAELDHLDMSYPEDVDYFKGLLKAGTEIN